MPRPRTYDDAVRARLLESASAALTHSGSHGLSLRAVAADAATTTAAVYTLFGSRAGLLRAVVDEGFRRFGSHLDAVPRTADPAADLLELGLAYRRSALAAPHFYRAMFQTPTPPPDDVAAPTFRRLEDAVARVLEARGAPAADATETALGLWALVHGLVSLEIDGHLPGDQRERDARYLRVLRSQRGGPAGAGR